MANLLKVFCAVVWTEESIPIRWRQGLIVSIRDVMLRTRVITLLNVVRKQDSKLSPSKQIRIRIKGLFVMIRQGLERKGVVLITSSL